MISRDRRLLAKLMIVNSELGKAVVELMHSQDAGELPPEGYRELAKHLGSVVHDMEARAAELDSRDSGYSRDSKSIEPLTTNLSSIECSSLWRSGCGPASGLPDS